MHLVIYHTGTIPKDVQGNQIAIIKNKYDIPARKIWQNGATTQGAPKRELTDFNSSHSLYMTTDPILRDKYLAKSTHFSIIFFGDRRVQMIPTKSGCRII